MKSGWTGGYGSIFRSFFTGQKVWFPLSVFQGSSYFMLFSKFLFLKVTNQVSISLA